ncbi:hypothetical protein Nepgr_003295 [Nepenthes gracilis]|uniref:Uncharacterized protein n=1 Tax=Nepenthes gracilis TaxID=150966 RepID=A0AAD3XDN8_NEPGR|nr:hypothetical protein Nepgr_003295 [Nepenthes gracilis]
MQKKQIGLKIPTLPKRSRHWKWKRTRQKGQILDRTELEVQLENVDHVGVEEVPSESIEAEVGVVREEEIHEAVEVICPRSFDAKAPVGPVAIMNEFQEIMNPAAVIANEFANDYVEKEKFLKAKEQLLKIEERLLKAEEHLLKVEERESKLKRELIDLR